MTQSDPSRSDLSHSVSTAPNGEAFPLPAPEDYDREISWLQQLCKAQQDRGRQVVVVMGVGFVGAVMAGVVADAWDRDTNDSPYFVIGMQRPSPRSFWKIPMLNRGLAHVEAEDPEVAPLISRCVLEKQTLTASFAYEALGLADIVVVDVQCDYLKDRLGNVREVKGLERGHIKRIKDRIQKK